MKRLERLQQQLKDGKITHAEYLEKVVELFEDELITAEQQTEANKVEAPKDAGDDLIYSQTDVDKIIKSKAEALIKKSYRDAGLEVPKGKDLTEAVTEALKAGDSAGKNDSDLAKENAILKTAALKSEGSADKVTNLQRENAVLRVANKYNPHNVSRVVAALNDYSALLDYDDDGNLDPKSVEKVISTKLLKAEAYLFNTDAGGEGGGGENGAGGQGAGENGAGGASGKGPGGGGGAGGGGDDKSDAQLAKARDLMGWKKETTE